MVKYRLLGSSLATLGIYGTCVYLGLRTPLPGADEDVSRGLHVSRHEFETPDGLTLRLKRYANPGGTPVLLCHGFGSTGFSFDLPRSGRNLAVYLARHGLDVWISSFRGCGRGEFTSDGGDWNHSIDHLAAYDAPTLVDGIFSETGSRPFWIGHSMGGAVLYMYLQGIGFDGQKRVFSDPDLVAERHEKLLGGITIGSPTAWEWSHPHGSWPARRVIEGLVTVMRKKELTSARIYRFGGRNRRLDRHPRIVMAISRTPLAETAYHVINTDKNATTALALWGTSDVSAGMYVQLLTGLLNGRIREHQPGALIDDPYDYTEHMPLVSLPILFITGDKDVANAETIRRFNFIPASGEGKSYLCLDGYGHTDPIMGKNAEREVFPIMLERIISST